MQYDNKLKGFTLKATKLQGDTVQTLCRILELARDAATEDEILSLIDDEATSCVVNGDLLGAGELLTSRINYSKGIDPGAVAAKILALWASPSELSFSPSGMRD